MTDKPAYYIWHAAWRSSDIASIFMVPGQCHDAPAGDRDFFESLRTLLGVDVPLLAWSVDPFMTRFFTQGEWQECWEVGLLLAQKVKKIPLPAGPIPIAEVPVGVRDPGSHLPVCVLAEFESRKDAVECRDALKQIAEKAKWNDVHFERYRIRELASGRKQLVVDVLTVDRARIQDAIPAAEEVILICNSFNGRTQYDAQ